MFKIGTALVTGAIAAFFAVFSAISAGARFSTAAGRSLAAFLVVAALVFLVAFLLEKQFPALFVQADEPDLSGVKKEKELSAANDTESQEYMLDAEDDGEMAEAQAEDQEQEQDMESEVMEEAVAVPRGE